MTKDEALKLALEGAANYIDTLGGDSRKYRQALAEQPAQQEPVATLWQHGETGRTRITMPGDITDCDARWFKAADLYTSPLPHRKPLTYEEIEAIGRGISAEDYGIFAIARAIEAAHSIKEQP